MAADIRVLAIDEGKGPDSLGKQVRGGALTLIGESGYGAGAVTAVQESEPDVILVRLAEPMARALRTIEVLSVTFPNRGIVAVTSSSDREVTRRAIRAGARDYLTTPFTRDDLERSIVAVYEAEGKRKELTSAGPAISKGDVIVVFGVKGGIGKTTLAVNLAIAIAHETNGRVALVDLDVQMGDVALMLNVTPERNISDAAANAGHLEPELVQSLVYPDSSGIRVLPSVANPEDSASITADQIGSILDALVRSFDYVVVDTTPALTDINVTSIDRAVLTLLLTSPELSSIKRTKITLDVLRSSLHYPEERLKLVVNIPFSQKSMPREEIEGVLQMPIYRQLPFDGAVADAVKVGRPVIETKPKGRFSQAVTDLARAICGIHPKKAGLFAFLARSR